MRQKVVGSNPTIDTSSHKALLIKNNNCVELFRNYREFSSDIKGLLAVEYVVLFYEAEWIDEVQHEFDMNLTKKIAVG